MVLEQDNHHQFQLVRPVSLALEVQNFHHYIEASEQVQEWVDSSHQTSREELGWTKIHNFLCGRR